MKNFKSKFFVLAMGLSLIVPNTAYANNATTEGSTESTTTTNTEDSATKLNGLVAQAEEILKRNLKEEYKKLLTESKELANAAITANDQTSITQLIEVFEKLIVEADANTVTVEEPKRVVEIKYNKALEPVEEGHTSISVISDTHVISEKMIADNDKYTQDLEADRKLFNESEGLLKQSLEMIKKRGSKILIISGDLTKDGEKLSHEVVSQHLSNFGGRVFVVPGNHDINNTHAYNYNVNGATEKTATVTPDEFISIYNDTVFSKALELYKDTPYYQEYLNQVNAEVVRDENYKKYAHGYTSYVSRIDLGNQVGRNGLTIIGLDTLKYTAEKVASKKDGVQETGGDVTIQELKWIAEKVQEAKKRNDAIFLIAHHAFIPHFNNQETILSPYIIDSWNTKFKDEDPRFNGKTPAEIVADLGVSYLFTGHMHAQDISKIQTASGNTLYDIETGSTVTYPLPVRHLDLKNEIEQNNGVKLKVQSEYINEFEFTNIKGKKVKIDDALSYSANNLLTPDLAVGLINDYVPQDLSIKSVLGMIPGMEGVSTDTLAPYVIEFAKARLGSEANPFTTTVGGLGNVKVFYGNDVDVNGEKVNGIRLNVEASALFFSGVVDYIIKESSIAEILAQVIEEVDTKVLGNKELVNKVINSLATALFKSPITHEDLSSLEKGQKITNISDLANQAYLTHLKGDETQVEELKLVVKKYANTSLIKDIITNSKEKVTEIFTEVLSSIKNPIATFVTKIKSSGWLASTIEGQVDNIMNSKDLATLLSGVGFGPEKLVDTLLEMDFINAQLPGLDSKILDIVSGLTSEEQAAYAAYRHTEDNNTLLTNKAEATIIKEVPFKTIYVASSELEYGKTKETKAGIVGETEIVKFEDKVISEKELKAPENRIVAVGNILVKEREIPFNTKYSENKEVLEKDSGKILVAGQKGIERETIEATVDAETGTLAAGAPKVETVKPVIDQVIEKGIKVEDVKPVKDVKPVGDIKLARTKR